MGAKILVVEDEPTNRLVLQGILRKLGHQATLVTNGREALAALAQARFDLVLLDVRMPEMDGHETVRALRAPDSPALDPNTVVIALTANATADERARCLASGMDDFLTKPVIIATLDQTLTAWQQRGWQRISPHCSENRRE